MLLIFLLLTTVILAYGLYRKFPQKYLKFTVCALIIWLFIETFSFAYLTWTIFSGRANIFLIGNQKVLDALIMTYWSNKIHRDRRHPYGIYEINDRLGFTVSPDKRTFQFPTTNSAGMRALKEYGLFPEDNTFRVLALGDSYVFCDGELTINCWTNILENSVANLEVLNFGVSGYGLGQSYLRYVYEAAAYHPDLVIINYTDVGPRDAINAATILSGSTLNSADLYRPVFWIEEDRLRSITVSPFDFLNATFREKFLYNPTGIAINNTIWTNPFLGLSSTFVLIKQAALPMALKSKVKQDFYTERQTAALNIKIMENFLESLRRNRSEIIFTNTTLDRMSDEMQELLARYRDIAHLYSHGEIMMELARRQGISREDILNDSRHYNPRGNGLYAQAILVALRERQWGLTERKFEFDKNLNGFVRHDGFH